MHLTKSQNSRSSHIILYQVTQDLQQHVPYLVTQLHIKTQPNITLIHNLTSNQVTQRHMMLLTNSILEL